MRILLVIFLISYSSLAFGQGDKDFQPAFSGRKEYIQAAQKAESVFKMWERLIDIVVGRYTRLVDELNTNGVDLALAQADVERLLRIITDFKLREMHEEVSEVVPKLRVRIDHLRRVLEKRNRLFSDADAETVSLKNFESWPSCHGFEKLRANTKPGQYTDHSAKPMYVASYFRGCMEYLDDFLGRIPKMTGALDKDIMKGAVRNHKDARTWLGWINEKLSDEDARAILFQDTDNMQKRTNLLVTTLLSDAEAEYAGFSLLSDGESYYYDPALTGLRKSTFESEIVGTGKKLEDYLESEISSGRVVGAAFVWHIIRYGLSIGLAANKVFKNTNVSVYLNEAMPRIQAFEYEIRDNFLANAILDRFYWHTNNYEVDRSEWE